MRALTDETLEQQLRDAMTAGAWSTVDALALLLDQRDNTARATHYTPSMCEAALFYASQGLPVFPLQPGKKIPMPGSHGCKDATCNPTDIRAWWGRNPDANIGIATGGLVDVIDLDGTAGLIAWSRLAEEGVDLPPLVGEVKTPRPGGWHLYVRSLGLRNGAGLAPGVDYRGAGGYVVAPPSHVTTATYTGGYSWRQQLCLDAEQRAA